MELQEVFKDVCAKQYKGVAGIDVWDSGRPGPTVGITMMTHGNEPAGLAAYGRLKAEGLQDKLLTGKVIWILQNIEAAGKYLRLPKDATMETKISTRQIDWNLNRMPRDLETVDAGHTVELKRAKELLPIWREFEYGFDIHTTSQEAPPILLTYHGINSKLVRGLPVEKVMDFSKIPMGELMCMCYYGTAEDREAQKVFMLEMGQHESEEAFDRAVACVRALLGNIGVIDREHEVGDKEMHVYEMDHEIFFPHESYKAVEIFPNFAEIKAGQLFAEGEGEPIYFREDGHVMMCPATGRPPNHKLEAAVFMSKPMQRIIIPVDAVSDAVIGHMADDFKRHALSEPSGPVAAGVLKSQGEG